MAELLGSKTPLDTLVEARVEASRPREPSLSVVMSAPDDVPTVPPNWWGSITYRFQNGKCTLVETTETRKP